MTQKKKGKLKKNEKETQFNRKRLLTDVEYTGQIYRIKKW